MKNYITLFLLCLCFGHLDAQFFHAFGEPDLDFQATQLKVLNGDTYVSGWFTDPSVPATAGNTEEGVIFRLNAAGQPDWVYRLDSQTPPTVVNGTRIYDFDFDDGGDHIVFVGATSIVLNGGFRDNDCIIGMIELGTGNAVLQESHNFRSPAREMFLRIANDPTPTNPDSYFISGNINDAAVINTIDNYIGGRVTVDLTNGVNFNWINEHNYVPATNAADQEMANMRVVEFNNNIEVIYAGIDNPTGINGARMNFHGANGVVLDELLLNQGGYITDMAQIPNTTNLVVIGQLRGNNPAQGSGFITILDLVTRNIISNSISFPTAQVNLFSRVAIDPTTGDIYVTGERAPGMNSIIARFQFPNNNGPLAYLDSRTLNFGVNGPGNALLAFDNNNAYWADTHSGFNTPFNAANLLAPVVRTNLLFESCSTEDVNLTPDGVNLNFMDAPGVAITRLTPDPENLDTVPSEIRHEVICCPNTPIGGTFSTISQVAHGTNGKRVVTADINQDGWIDFALPDVGFSGTPKFSISENNFNLGFTNYNSIASTTSIFGDAEAMEFIHLPGTPSLEPDLIVYQMGNIEIYENLGGGDFLLLQTIFVTVATPPNGSNVVGLFRSDFDLVDYDNDGNLDLVITGASAGQSNPDPRIAIFLGNGASSAPNYFNATPIQTLAGLPAISYWETKHLDIDPANNNGNDLLMGEAGFNGASQSIFGYLHNPASATTLFPTTPSLVYETPTGLIWPRGLEMIDMNANSQLDIVTAMQAEELINGTPTGNGALLIARDVPITAGTYTAASLQWQVFNIPGQPVGIDIGDIDGDGDNDVVVAVHQPTSFVRVYENDGSGDFPTFTDYATPGGATTEVKLVDFNNDCCLDIVTAQWFGSTSYVLINDCENSEFVITGEVRCEDNPCSFTGSVAPNQLVSATIGNVTYYATTGSNGVYTLNVPQGTYDVALDNGNYGSGPCTSAFTNIATNITPLNISVVNFAMAEVCELDVNMVGALIGTVGTNTCPFIATPCEDLIWEYCIEIENSTCSIKNINQIVVNLPHGISSIVVNEFIECGTQNPVSFGTPGAVPIQTNLFGSTITYSTVNPIPPGTCYSACVQATFNGGFVMPVTAEVNVDFACDTQLGQNSSTVAYQDTCSCDPNLKLAYFPQNCGSPDEVLDQPIEYTIQFSNIGQTPAYFVLIEDQLDANLDWSTFQWIGSSHPFSNLTMTSGLLAVEFNNIILPPSAAGWIKFSVKPLASTPNNTVITNAADITFDNNAPVPTNTTTTEIRFPDAQASVQFDAETYCVGNSMYIDYLWTGDAAWLNFTQNGVPMGQNIPAPPSGTQIAFHISDFSYVGTWEYELITIDSLTGCTDTARVVIVIDDCVCDEVFTGAEIDNRNCKQLDLQAAAHHQLSGSTLTLWDASSQMPSLQIVRFGDGTEVVYNPAQSVITYTYTSPGHYVIEYVAVVMLDDGSCCIDTYYLEIEVPEGDGGNDGDKLVGLGGNASVHIYPNPATRQVTLQSDLLKGLDETLTVQVYNASGKLLQQYQLQPNYGRLHLQLGKTYQGLVSVRVLNKKGELLLDGRFIKMD